MTQGVDADELRIIEAAAGWFARANDGPLDDRARRDFEAWMAADPRHADAYEGMRRLWQQTGTIDRIKGHGGRIGRRQLGIVVGLGLAGGLAWTFAARQSADVETARGETERLVLADGSRLDLAADTRLGMLFDGANRRIELLQGEIFVDVAPAAMPFVVTAGGAGITALGTAFGVAYHGDAVRTVVTEHAVRVEAAGTERLVSGGEALTFDGRALGEPERLRDGIDFAWRDGRLAFANAPLDEVVATINRWRSNQLVVLPGLGHPAVTMMGEIDQMDRMIDELALAISARLVHVGPWMTLIVPA